ncbi:MAG: hypothetical protein ACR2JT_08845 [Nocardioidaceae bacterium]
MTTVAHPSRTERPVALVLAGHEARRLVTHPVTLVGWGLLVPMFMVSIFTISSPVAAFDIVTTGPTFYPGLFCVLAAHMITTRDHRAGADDLLGAVPATRQQRVRALLLAAWAPALIALVLNVVTLRYLVWQDKFVEIPGLAHVLQAPVTVLGGCLLGIMLGLWLPQRITPVLTMVALVAGSIVLTGNSHEWGLLGPLVSWADWGPTDGTVWYALEPGHPGAHVYLLGLCGLAAVAASLRVASRYLLVIAVGVVFLALTLWGGVSQLP